MITRLKIFIKDTSLSERAFALKCGIAQNTMSYYLNGQRKPSYEAVEKILSTFPDLSAEWLIRGKGEMLLSQNGNPDKQAERMNKLVDTIATLQEAINAKTDTIDILTARVKQLETQLNSK